MIALVLARSAIYVFWEQSYFDSDQAVMGLMGKHLSEGRALPVFMYGQNYILAVEAWMAAPMFLALGVSVVSLKLPLLAINLAVALLFLRIFERETGLRPALAGAAAVFFVLPAPGTAAHFLEASGGNLEPFLYVTLMWLTRRRPNWCGLIFGIGFLHREFTLYGLGALVVIEAIDRSLFTREGIVRRLKMLRTAAEVWLVVQVAQLHSSAAGPGTSIANVVTASNNLLELAERTCFNLRTVFGGGWKIVTLHWPRLFGTEPQPLLDFAIDSQLGQGLAWSGVFLAIAMPLAASRIGWRLVRERRWDRRWDFCAYLTLVGLFSVGGYVVGRCGEVGYMLRYELLSVAGAVGLSAWFLRVETSRPLRTAWMALVACWLAVAAVPHARLWHEYLTHPPYGVKRTIIRHLEAQGVRYGTADYWNAYYITFLTNERIILASDDFTRVLTYDRIVKAHTGETIRIARQPCPNGREVMSGVYFCRGTQP